MGEALNKVTDILGPAGQIVGAITGAQGLLQKKPKQQVVGPAQAPAFNPSKPGALTRPNSLSSFSSYSPEQERSALATQGVNGGLGAEEDAYYRNLIQRSLIGDDNKVTGDTNSLLPIESQYFSRQGINTSDVMKFLEQLKG